MHIPRGELQFLTANERSNYIEHANTGVLGQGFGLASHMKAVNNVLINTYKDIPLLPHLQKKPKSFMFKDQINREEVDSYGVKKNVSVS